MRCLSCSATAKYQLGWRCYPAGVPEAARGIALAIECWTSGAVCKHHVPAKIKDFLSEREIARINEFLVKRSGHMALDFDGGEVLARRIQREPIMAEVMRPVCGPVKLQTAAMRQ